MVRNNLQTESKHVLILKQEKSGENQTRGKQCSINGLKYEQTIHSVVKNCLLNGVRFNTQDVSELGGSSSKCDIVCHNGKNMVGIEVKKCKSPD